MRLVSYRDGATRPGAVPGGAEVVDLRSALAEAFAAAEIERWLPVVRATGATVG